ncbi:Malonyl CoA-acyl carrier protein transacylase [Rhodovulum sp. P5]|uniref:type I polyketide synthase n=1 Tax=Rhodovulum sp. P5 TaxID=1564506 RepID=UPI0009C3DB4A|nr:type I polyketide synthase [Rhodovulum sp. P5]ARE39414.1 Malonyl CoA-acyl carrier protein transacylase [Rhodovulum sp. P5]
MTGYSALLPGARGADEVWRVLTEGRCVISEIPEDRWSGHRFLSPEAVLAGHSYTRHAGVLEEAFGFDAGYFGITPREAEQMDPQQRLLLETTARAFDHAGIDPDRLQPDRVGVFIGAATADHSTTALQDPKLVGAQYMLGNTVSIFANRLSHHWDFRGPSFTVDTACSSALVALDQARRAIAAGVVDMAVVGGVNLLLSPMPFIGFSQAGMLSPTGRCRAFAAGADGYVRSEGAVVFILERLDTALPSGRRVRSVLVTSAVNTAGRTPGIALPSAERQADLMVTAMEAGGIDPDSLAFVEAHGTGTAVGDPLEAQAIGQSYGLRRRSPLPVGSSKSNFGHLEPAAGLVGLLKAQLALEHGHLPATLHCEEPNPDIDFAALNLDLASEGRDLPDIGGPLCAAVNSFGFGGANAHVVLRQPDLASVGVQRAGRRPQGARSSLLLSAASGDALQALARSWRDMAAAAPDDLADRVATANWRRACHRHRLCVAADSAEALVAELDGWLGDGGAAPGAAADSTLRDAPVAFVYSGNGAIWTGAGRHLFETDPVFRRAFVDLAEEFAACGLPDIRDLIDDPELAHKADAAEVAQPLTFAVQVALTDSLVEAGLRPKAVLGHSLGEVAAAVIAGRIPRADGVQIVAQRCRAFAPLRGTGAMAALAAARTRVEALIAETGLPVEVSAENAPESVTVSGPEEVIKDLLGHARRARIAGRALPIAYPYHSAAVEPLREELIAGLADLAPRKGTLAFYSGCQGAAFSGPLDAAYWWENARSAVSFRNAVTAMAEDGLRVFVEISPRTVLRSYLRDTLADFPQQTGVLESLDSTRPERRTAATIARAALAAGGAVDRTAVLGPARPVTDGLPDYPFDRSPYRLESATALDIFARRPQHPLLGGRIQPDAEIWQGEILLSRAPWLADHKVAGRILLPAMGILELFAAAGADLAGARSVELRDVEFLAPIELSETEPLSVRVVHEGAARRLRLETGGAGRWQLAAVARLFTASAEAPGPIAVPDAGGDPAALYSRLAESGLDYGPEFARVAGLTREDTSVLARIAPALPEPRFVFDPRAADAALHGAALLLDGDDTGLRVPARIDRVCLFDGGEIVAARLTRAGGGAESVALDGLLCDADGAPVLVLEGLRLRPFPAGQEPAHPFWDERLVPLPGGGAAWLPAAVQPLLRADGDAANDADVLRAALGGRLAWDRLAAGGGDDPRDAIAARWLVEAGHASEDADGNVTPSGDCPWPEIDTLVSLLPQVAPQASAVLKSVLEAAAGRAAAQPQPLADLSGLPVALLNGPAAGRVGRIALCGAVDRELVDAALRRADHVTVLAGDGDALARQRARLGGHDALRFATVDAAAAQGDADLLVLSGVMQDPAAEETLDRLCACIAPGGGVLAVEEAPDIFALMTGRHTRPGAVDRLMAALDRAGLTAEAGTAVASESLRVISARRAPGVVATPVLQVTGDGAIADGLRAASGQGDAAAVVVVCGRLGDDLVAPADLIAALPDGAGPVWLLVEGAEHWAALTGWRRTLANETGRDLRLLCHDADIPAERIAPLLASEEQEILLTAEGAHCPRLIPVDPTAVADGARRLTVARRGAAQAGLRWTPVPDVDLSEDAVEIDVAAAGLNFRDVMWAQGLLPPEALEEGFAGACLGMECAGTVRRAGPKAGFAPGDAVLAMASHAMSNRVVTPADAVLRLPDGIDPVTAAGVPVVFLTADYALNEVARIAPGETVLIHGAAGGVGQAALQVARRAGARVIATAGNPAKRLFVRALGAEAVFDSRSLSFDDDVRAATDGRGVDAVLNALAGEALERSLACLAPFGRFVELGKRDLYENSAVALRAMRRNISLHVVDVDQLMTHRPEAAARCLARLAEALESGDYVPLPTEVFAPQDAAEAMRAMQRAAHIGKIVLRAPDHAAPAPVAPVPPIRGAWLITGGTSGFGLETARWLADQGAEHLWLTSRSGRVEDGALDGIGVPVTPLAADVTDAAAMADVLAQVQAGDVPLRGVVHGAAVFDDAMFADLDRDRMAAVLAPKLGGAQVLDRLTREIPLDHFWMFSSVAARFGNPAQAPYVAANRGLEGIAKDRAARGLPALAVAWGPVGDAGYLSRSEALREALAKRMTPMTAHAALAYLGYVLQAGYAAPTVTIAPVNWGRLAGALPVMAGPLFDLLQIDPERTDAGGFDLAALLRDKGPKEARKILTKMLVEEAAQLMRAAPGDIDPRQPLQMMGFDSLMAMNLRLAVEERLDITVPVMSIDDSLTLAVLVNRIVDGASAEPGTAPEGGVVAEMAERHLAGSEVSAERAASLKEMAGATVEDG